MDAVLTKTQRVLHLVQPTASDRFPSSFEPSRLVTFTSVPLDTPPGVVIGEAVMFQMPWSLWTELGRPDDVTP